MGSFYCMSEPCLKDVDMQNNTQMCVFHMLVFSGYTVNRDSALKINYNPFECYHIRDLADLDK